MINQSFWTMVNQNSKLLYSLGHCQPDWTFLWTLDHGLQELNAALDSRTWVNQKSTSLKNSDHSQLELNNSTYTRCEYMISGNRNIKKTVIVTTFGIFSFCQYGRQRSSRTSGSALVTTGPPRRSSPLCYFSYPPPSPSRRPLEREWRQPALSSPPAASQTVRTLSKIVKESRLSLLRPPQTSWIAPSSIPRKTIC